MPGSLVRKVGQTFFDLLLPPKCIHCKAAGRWLCQSCLEKIPLITGSLCPRCGAPLIQGAAPTCRHCRSHPLSAIDGIRAAAVFADNPLRSAIHEFKYNNHRAVTAILGEMLLTAYQRYGLEAEVILPVPLHEARLKERGYNQSELLARPLGQALNLPVELAALRRVRKTESQMTLGSEERYKNVSGAFACGDTLAGRRVLLVDDVCTTGSTLDACAAALKAGGAASVWGLTLAKAL